MRPAFTWENKTAKFVSKLTLYLWIRRSLDLAPMLLGLLIINDRRNAAEAMASYLSFDDMECRLALKNRQCSFCQCAESGHPLSTNPVTMTISRLIAIANSCY